MLCYVMLCYVMFSQMWLTGCGINTGILKLVRVYVCLHQCYAIAMGQIIIIPLFTIRPNVETFRVS